MPNFTKLTWSEITDNDEGFKPMLKSVFISDFTLFKHVAYARRIHGPAHNMSRNPQYLFHISHHAIVKT